MLRFGDVTVALSVSVLECAFKPTSLVGICGKACWSYLTGFIAWCLYELICQFLCCCEFAHFFSNDTDMGKMCYFSCSILSNNVTEA